MSATHRVATVRTTKADGLCSVRSGSITVAAQCPRDLTVAVGDQVLIVSVAGSWYVLDRYYTSAVGDPAEDEQPEPPTAPKVVTGTTTLVPTRTASYRTSYGWRSDNDSIYQGNYGGWGNHTGCAFYGNAPRGLAGATVTDAWLKARRLSGGDYAVRTTTLRRIEEASKPAGAPTLVAGDATGPALAVGKTDTHVDVPISWAQGLVDGGIGGLAIYEADGAPYVRLAGLSSYGGAFALTIEWSRTTS